MIQIIFEAYLKHIRGGSSPVRTHKQKTFSPNQHNTPIKQPKGLHLNKRNNLPDIEHLPLNRK